MLRYGSFYDAVRVILEEGAADASWLGRYSGFYRGFQASLMLQAVELLRDRVGTRNHDLRPRSTHGWAAAARQSDAVMLSFVARIVSRRCSCGLFCRL